MIDREDGLTEICHVFDKFTNQDGRYTGVSGLDFTKGILQAIGYKEFAHYYHELKEGTATEESLEKAKETLCLKTLNYANTQVKWLEKRIRPIFGRKMSGIDDQAYPDLLRQITLNDASRYEEIALTEALAFVQATSNFYQEMDLSVLRETYCSNYLKEKSRKFSNHEKFICVECNYMELIGEKQYLEHLKTKKHQGNVVRAKKKQNNISDQEFYREKNLRKKELKQQKSSPSQRYVQATEEEEGDFCIFDEEVSQS